MRGSRTDYRTDTLTAGRPALVRDTFNGFHIVRSDLLTVSGGKVYELVQTAGTDTWCPRDVLNGQRRCE